MAHDVFLSYSRKDSAMKDRVQKSLADAGLSVWTDANLTPGTPEWFQAIERAIDATRVLVVLLSPDAKQSEWVQKEIGYAKAWKKPIFPILVRGDEAESTPFQIFGTQYVDVRDNSRYSGEMGRLIDAIKQGRDFNVSSKLSEPIKDEPSKASSATSLDNLTSKPKLRNTPKSNNLIPVSKNASVLRPYSVHPATSRLTAKTKTGVFIPDPDISDWLISQDKRSRFRFKAWNPLHQVFIWIYSFFNPQVLWEYDLTFDYYSQGGYGAPLISALTFLPLLVPITTSILGLSAFPIIPGQLGLIPPVGWLLMLVSVALLTGYAGVDNLHSFDGYLPAIIIGFGFIVLSATLSTFFVFSVRSTLPNSETNFFLGLLLVSSGLQSVIIIKASERVSTPVAALASIGTTCGIVWATISSQVLETNLIFLGVTLSYEFRALLAVGVGFIVAALVLVVLMYFIGSDNIRPSPFVRIAVAVVSGGAFGIILAIFAFNVIQEFIQ